MKFQLYNNNVSTSSSFRETYSSLSPYNTEEKREYKSATSKPSTKDTRFYRTSSNNSDKSVSGKGKCRASSLDRSKSLSHLPSCSSGVKIEQRHAKSTENIAQVTGESRSSKSTDSVSQAPSEAKPESSGVGSAANSGVISGTLKPSRSQKNKTLLKSVIAECLSSEGISSDHPRFKSLSS